MLGGIWPVCIAISTLAIAKKLDAAFACPRLDLIEPMSRGEERL
jgi:hypothetical protein